MYAWWGFLIYFGVLAVVVALAILADRSDKDDIILEAKPSHVVARVVVAQALFYFAQFFVLFSFDLPFQERFRASQVLNWHEFEFDTQRGRVCICSGVLASLALSVWLIPVQKRPTLIADYVFTAHFVHFIAVCIHSRSFPASGAWWVSHIASIVGCAGLSFGLAYKVETLSMPSERARNEDAEEELRKLQKYDQKIATEHKPWRRMGRSLFRASRRLSGSGRASSLSRSPSRSDPPAYGAVDPAKKVVAPQGERADKDAVEASAGQTSQHAQPVPIEIAAFASAAASAPVASVAVVADIPQVLKTETPPMAVASPKQAPPESPLIPPSKEKEERDSESPSRSPSSSKKSKRRESSSGEKKHRRSSSKKHRDSVEVPSESSGERSRSPSHP